MKPRDHCHLQAGKQLTDLASGSSQQHKAENEKPLLILKDEALVGTCEMAENCFAAAAPLCLPGSKGQTPSGKSLVFELLLHRARCCLLVHNIKGTPKVLNRHLNIPRLLPLSPWPLPESWVGHDGRLILRAGLLLQACALMITNSLGKAQETAQNLVVGGTCQM